MSAPTAQSKGKWLYYERYYYDVFALNQRLSGIFANIASLPTIGTITFTTEAGATGQTVVNGLPDLPYGQIYVAQAGASAANPTYGQKLTTGWTQIQNGGSIAASSGNQITVAAVNVNQGNAAVAAGSAAAVVGS